MANLANFFLVAVGEDGEDDEVGIKGEGLDDFIVRVDVESFVLIPSRLNIERASLS